MNEYEKNFMTVELDFLDGTEEEIEAKMNELDPNHIFFCEDYEEIAIFQNCVTVNDYINWNSLNGEVVTYSIKDLK